MSTTLQLGGSAAALLVLWLWRINQGQKWVPEEMRKLKPNYWTEKEMREMAERLKKNPIDFTKALPPRLDRRYIVVGGSGLVGGDIVMQLLARGQRPESIRIVDFMPLSRPDMIKKASECDFVKADMTSMDSVKAAFSKPWASSVAKFPLTVFHTAALIRAQERKEIFYDRVSRINRDGTTHVLQAARAAGADIFVATSSASVGVHRPRVWLRPWESKPEGYFEVADESDFDAPIRPHDEFFANYARSKAESERIVCAANKDGFRTGAIRPGNAIYGNISDPVLARFLHSGEIVTWLPHIRQHFVSGRNVALAHLLHEAALARPGPMPRCAGRPYVVTDPGGPIAFMDMYLIAMTLSDRKMSFTLLQPILIMLLSYAIEYWCLLLAYLPFLTWLGLSEPAGDIRMLQPATLFVSKHVLIDDSAARKSIEEGGIGYQGVCTTLEGMTQQVLEANENLKVENVGANGSLKAKVTGAGASAVGNRA